MKQARGILKRVDMNGVPYIVQTEDGKALYQSHIGGMATVTMYTLILVYLTITVYQWAQGQMISKITTEYADQLSNSSSSLMNLDVKITIHNYNQDDWTQDIDNQFFMIEADQKYQNIPLVNGAYYTNLQFVSIVGGVAATNQIFLNVYKCDPSLLTIGSCAPKEQIDALLNNSAIYLSLKFNLSIVNPNTFTNQQISKVFWMGLDYSFCKVSTLELIASEFHLSKGQLFQPKEVRAMFTDLHYYMETQTQSYCKKSLLFQETEPIEVLGQMFFSMDYISSVTTIEYPGVFDVAANIGAISQIIMLIRFAAVFYNQKAQGDLVLDTLARALYPELRLVNEQRGLKTFGRLKTVQLDKKELEKKSYMKFRKDLHAHLQKQITFHNIVINQFKFDHFMHTGDAQFRGYKIKRNQDDKIEEEIDVESPNSAELHNKVKESLQILPQRSKRQSSNDQSINILRSNDLWTNKSPPLSKFRLGASSGVNSSDGVIRQSEADFDLDSHRLVDSQRISDTEHIPIEPHGQQLQNFE